MATKSNAIKYSYGMKITAFLLATVCVFSAAWCSISVTKMLHDYGWENLLVRENAEFTDTLSFYDGIAEASALVSAAHLSGDWETVRAEKYGTAEEEVTYALRAFRSFLLDIEQEAKKQYQYTVTAEDSSRYGENAVVTVVNGENIAAYDKEAADAYIQENHYQSYSLHFFPKVTLSFHNWMTEDEVRQAVSDSYANALAQRKQKFESQTLIAREALAKYGNFSYMAIQPETGTVVTNTPFQTPEDFLQGFTGEAQGDTAANSAQDWVLGYTAEKGVVFDTEIVSADMLYNRQMASAGYQSFADILSDSFSRKGYDVYLRVSLPLTKSDTDPLSVAYTDFTTNTSRLAGLLFAAMLLLAAAVLLSIYLVLVAGRTQTAEGVQMSLFDRIPTDLHFLLACGTAFFLLFGAVALLNNYVFEDTAVYYIRKVSLVCVAASGLCAAAFALLLEWFTSIAKFSKARQPYFRATLVYRIWHAAANGVRRCKAWVKRITHEKLQNFRKMIWLTLAIFVTANLFCGLIFWGNPVLGIFALVLCNGAAALYVRKFVLALDKIITASENGKNGTPTDMQAEQMPEPLCRLAKNLTVTQAEMQAAIEEAVKGERMKTELITNVSHDLKTPLTSIISYVDLLKKCDIIDTDAQKYITVLDEKSIRLKRLIEDLVEASKVSSGAVTLNKMQVNLYELATQAVGEVGDGFTERQLTLVLNTPETAPVIFADSQKTWRIIDNLLSNARKYSLAGSRVYVDVERRGNFGALTIKNTSCEALNIDPQELTQRFVRGDTSRTKEGSGLGLSIAKDLCALQGGELTLEIDGDLFKATVYLPLATQSQVVPVN